MSFSRQDHYAPKVIEPLEQLRQIDSMVQRLLGEDIRYRLDVAPGVGNIRMDPSAFEQVVINLAVNARDAMPRGGSLCLEARNWNGSLEDGDATDYVVISVRDNGSGMSEPVRLRAFEAFYTTKETGKGTGLGLATCHRLIKRANGTLHLESKEGEGTTVRLYLPHTTAATGPGPVVEDSLDMRGSETILVVEDDDSVRRLCCRALKEAGYRVLNAANAFAALGICEEEGIEIDMILTDVIIPDLNGRDLVEQVSHIIPTVRVLFMSGYAGEILGERNAQNGIRNILHKPFTAHHMLSQVRIVLDRAQTDSFRTQD